MIILDSCSARAGAKLANKDWSQLEVNWINLPKSTMAGWSSTGAVCITSSRGSTSNHFESFVLVCTYGRIRMHTVCTGMYWYVLVFDGTCLLGWDAQEWIGSLARRGICLLHLVDEEVGFLVWLCPVSHAESMNSASAETWNQKWPLWVIWCQELSLLEGRVGHIRRILPGSAARCLNSTSNFLLCASNKQL